LSTATALTIIYSFSIPHQTDYVYEPVAAAFYAGFHRLGWTLSLAWIVIACSKGYGGPVNAILSWSGFQPLSKLTYAAYLTHVVVINAKVATSRATEFYSFYEIVSIIMFLVF
jgi:peptidoglycan/LPS O-acetylase OafA/YrhL